MTDVIFSKIEHICKKNIFFPFFSDSFLIGGFRGYIIPVGFSDSILSLPPKVFPSTPLFYRSNAVNAAVFRLNAGNVAILSIKSQ